MKLKFWILFGAVQAFGLLLPLVGNVHSNIAPLLIGAILLLPASLMGFLFPDLAWWGWYPVAVGINALVRYFAARHVKHVLGS